MIKDINALEENEEINHIDRHMDQLSPSEIMELSGTKDNPFGNLEL